MIQYEGAGPQISAQISLLLAAVPCHSVTRCIRLRLGRRWRPAVRQCVLHSYILNLALEALPIGYI